jgi:hypothetical protein
VIFVPSSPTRTYSTHRPLTLNPELEKRACSPNTLPVRL